MTFGHKLTWDCVALRQHGRQCEVGLMIARPLSLDVPREKLRQHRVARGAPAPACDACPPVELREHCPCAAWASIRVWPDSCAMTNSSGRQGQVSCDGSLPGGVCGTMRPLPGPGPRRPPYLCRSFSQSPRIGLLPPRYGLRDRTVRGEREHAVPRPLPHFSTILPP
jgi:hypothetical protein